MSNEFDLERAKRGEPVQFSEGSMDGSTPQRWVDVNFIGLMASGVPVIEYRGGVLITGALRMKPNPQYALLFQTESDRNAAHCRLAGLGMQTLSLDIPEANA